MKTIKIKYLKINILLVCNSFSFLLMLKFTTSFICILLLISFTYPSEAEYVYNSEVEDTFNFLSNTLKYSNDFNIWIEEFKPFIHSFEHYIHLFENWVSNHKFIEETNSKFLDYSLKHNQFSGMSQDEFKSYMGFARNSLEYHRRQTKKQLNVFSDKEYNELPSNVDWRISGVVTPIKDQGQCGSCYSFSNTGSLESAYAIKYGSIVSLSEQQIVDCSQTKYGGPNYGCDGGMISETMSWIGKYGGLCLEEDYPYISGATRVSSNCKKSCKQMNETKIISFTSIQPNSDLAMMSALVHQPVSIAIEADQREFQFYSGGVFTGTCGTNLDHAVILVGYGTDKNSLDYYILRNSWGTSWGDQGYMYIARGSKYNNGRGQCGSLMEGSFPNL
jgi:C1A family cysteine protease